MDKTTATRIDAMQVTPEVTKLVLASFADVTYDHANDTLVCPNERVAMQVRAICQSYAIGARAAMRALVVTNAVDQEVATAMLRSLTLDEGATVPSDTPPAPAPVEAPATPEVTDTEVNAPQAEATDRVTDGVLVKNKLGTPVPGGKRIRVCEKCKDAEGKGTGTFKYANGSLGTCNPCQGKGWQTEDDIDRTSKYWTFVQTRAKEAEARQAELLAQTDGQGTGEATA